MGSTTGDTDPTVVETDLGPVRGTTDGQVRVFRGIPYAAPPRGEQRWRSPRPAAAWSDVRDATQAGDACPQPTIRPARQSENCLNLMVTTGAAPSDGVKPVMVFLDAGGLVVSSNAGVDHRRLVTQGDVVVVQPNERVGLSGFFAHPDLDEPGAGAFGLQDQQAALQWVQRNIAAFGGDPGNVTLFGISGGAVCVCAHLTAPASAGLFHRAIVQSGAAHIDLSTYIPGAGLQHLVRSLDQVRAAGVRLAEELGCGGSAGTMACLRDVAVESIAEHAGAFAAFAYGNAVLPQAPIEALRAGWFHRVPVMIGGTRDEASFWVNQAYPDGMDDAIATELLGEGTSDPDAVSARYRAGDYGGSAAAAVSAAQSDRFALHIRRTQSALAPHVSVFAFEFDDRTAPLDPGYNLAPQDEVDVAYGAYHGSEFQYLIDTDTHRARFDPQQAYLADQMIAYWTAFAHHGRPDAAPGTTAWPVFDDQAPVQHVQRLTTRDQGGVGPVGDHVARHQLDFWEQVIPPR